MTTLTQDFMTSPEIQHPEQVNPGTVNSEEIREFKLNLGERYGWWEDNDPDPKKRDVAMVHGAVNDCRTKVLLDTGATVNIVSFDLARKLGLHLKSHKQTKVSGMGGVPTYIGASTQVKITLGPRVVYLLDVWIANIGEGIEVLLGMSFMFAAGVRISIREGLVTLPDEETIVICGWNPEERLGVDMPVETTSSWYLAPGESKVVKISYGMTNPQREVVWAGRGDRWVTRLIYAAKSWPVAVKVVNILDKDVWIDNRTPVARIVEKPKIRRVRFAEDASTQTDEVCLEGFPGSRDVAVDTDDLGDVPTDVATSAASQTAGILSLEVEIDSDFQGWRSKEGDSRDSVADDDDSLRATEDYWDIPISGMHGTPLEKLKQEYEHCMRLSTEDLDYEPAVYMREGSELLSQLRDQLVMLPEIKDLTPECKIEEADVGVPGKTTPEMEDQVRRILEYHRKIFLGDGNAAPPPARGVVCDLDVGDGKPVAQRPRSIAPHLWTKVYELLKKLLGSGLIETSTSPWASPIVIVLKKNGVDIRMCIDYRVVNDFIKLSHYPLPLIDDLLIGFEAKLISAFVCPYGHYQWVRMPFGLKNAPLICQAVLNKCLWGFLRLSPEEQAEVGQDVLDFLGLNSEGPRVSGDGAPRLSVLTDEMIVFQRNIPVPSQMGPVVGRSSYIDDIAHVKGVQSFMGSLNYYNKFIEDLPVIAAVLYELTEEQMKSRRDLSRAREAFEILKRKIVSTPLLRHPDRSRPFVIIPHANPWAASAVLGQEYDGIVHPVRFTGRVLNDAELRYHIAEKEVIAFLRVLEVFRTLVDGSPKIVVYTRYSVLKWLLTSQSADGRTVKWGLKLSHWDLEIRRVQHDEDGLAAILGAGITPREHLDEVAEDLIPAKGRVKPPVLDAQDFILGDVTENDADYHGLLKGLTLAIERGVQDVVVVGDSRIAIQQAQGLINCNQPNLQRKLAEYEVLKTKFKSVRLVHVKRAFNQAAHYLTSKTLALGESWKVEDAGERKHLQLVSKIHEKLVKPKVLLSAGIQKDDPQGVETLSEPMGPLEYQAERWRRIKVHQDKDGYLLQPKDFLRGNTAKLSHAQARKLGKVADDFVLDSREVLYRLSRSTRDRPRDMVDELRLVVPKALQPDILHYTHEDFQDGHQGITRTYEKLRSEFYWHGMYADVEVFVKECVDCASGKGRPQNPGPSPGNIEPRRPFEVVSMGFVTHLPKSARGNTFLLLFQDAFSGFVMCKPMSSTTAQDVAEVYEEQVFRRFGASSMLRHDQDPRFMSEVFTRFRELLGNKQRVTLAYRLQESEQQERSVQTGVRSIRAYIAEADQSDWVDHAERLMFALNTSFDATRLDTPFFLVHDWDAHGTVSAMLGPRPLSVQERTAYEWRRKPQRDYSYAQACAEDLQKKAKRRSGFAAGDAVWVYIPKVQPGLSRKLAHMWHGPFRIQEIHDNFRVKLRVENTGYRVNPWVHVSRLKPRALFPKRPTVEIEVNEDDDFDTALLPENSWEPDAVNDEYEVD
ncbi:Reverse transcriptase [Phytophthora palmivora]|uniref:RNA-directed DNA polymerase n=1 Tax=Phytophthora palmivora TaxID=4796 RepID=A0A2P4Y0R6_9STRA|nr:Reverse transcriptase [Phytophthora palmivora]